MPIDRTDILVVEDNPDDLELTLSALVRQDNGCQAAVARDGEEALDFLFARGVFASRSPDPPRLIVLDLKLPKVNGIEVLKQLKDDPRTRSIPIVIFTSSSEHSDLASTYLFGANSYIQKPVDFDEFRETIRSLASYWMVTNRSPPAQWLSRP